MVQDGNLPRIAFRREAQEKFAKDKFALIVFVIGIFAFLFQSSLILTSWGNLPPQIPIFYSHPWGDPMLGPAAAIWILPASAAIFLVLNFAVGLFLIRENLFLARVLFVFSLVISLAALYDVSKIVSLLV